MKWWMRPLVRLMVAILLPFLVPALVAGALWALPGDPVSILCPPGSCEGWEELARIWHLDHGPMYFYYWWIWNAMSLDFGTSWSVISGVPVYDEIVASIPHTAALVVCAMAPLFFGTVAAALGWLPRWLDPFWQLIGMVPAVILALLAAAYVEIRFGVVFNDWRPLLWKIGLGALVLGVADGALAGAIIGTRSVFEEEVKQRYIQIAQLRGETTLSNALPNVLPSMIGQFRGRVLHVISGTVVVEVVLGIPGLGDLLWRGTLTQDFPIILAAAFVIALVSGGMMLLQALSEIGIAMYVRRSPPGVVGGG